MTARSCIKKDKNIMKNLQSIYTKYSDLLRRVKNLHLCGLDPQTLIKLKDDIISLFEEISSIEFVKYTGASKALHAIAPRFFPLWDQNIREKYGVKEDGEGYYEFMVKTKNLCEEIIEDYRRSKGIKSFEEAREEIEKQIGVTLIKAIDEYNWLTTRSNRKIL